MATSDSSPCYLCDNGSLRPESTLSLRRVAAALAARTGRRVVPVSLLHSDKVPAEKLGGEPAVLLERALWAYFAAEPAGAVSLLPLFFGPSAALTEYIPERLRALWAAHPQARVRLAPWMVDVASPDRRMAGMLADQVLRAARAAGWTRPAVLLVDHGSPQRGVTAVRDHLAAQLRAELGDGVTAVGAASMERRPGAAYDFNDPLLAAALRTAPFDCGEVVVALQFLAPGRHAGAGGDMAEICRVAEAEQPGLRTRMTEPLAAEAGLVDVLADRLAEARAAT